MMAISNKKGKTIEDYTAEGEKVYLPLMENEIKSSNDIYDGQVKSTNESYDTQVFEQGRAYESQHRENAVQKEINKRQVAESMANLGLRDSGLNRTQQTAVQLSYGNNKANIDRQQQAGIDSLNLSRRQALDNIEQNRMATNANIKQTYMGRALEYGLQKQSEEQAKYQTIITGRIEAGQPVTAEEIANSGWSREYIAAMRSVYNGTAAREQYTTLAMWDIENGAIPDDKTLSKAGINKTWAKTMANKYKTAKTEADYKTIVTGYANAGVMPSDDLIEKSGMSKKEVKSLYNNARKVNKSTNTTDNSGSNKGDDEKKYKVRTAGGNGFDDNGNKVYYFYDENGTKKTYLEGINPYTGKPITGGYTAQELKEFGVWNGYQPKGVKYNGKNYGTVEKYQTEKGTVQIEHQGHYKTVWQTANGSLWVWDDEISNYVRAYDNGKGNISYETY